MRCGVLGVTLAVPVLGGTAHAADVRLKFLGKYKSQGWLPGDGGPDEITGVEGIGDHHALISSRAGIWLVDLNDLLAGGSEAYVDRIRWIDPTFTVTRDDGAFCINLRKGGLGIGHVDLDAGTLEYFGEILEILEEEPPIHFAYYEKMSIVGDRLYVAAHAYGLRIFDISDPTTPVLVGALTEGLDDAWAVEVDGTTAYVASGAAGVALYPNGGVEMFEIQPGETMKLELGYLGGEPYHADIAIHSNDPDEALHKVYVFGETPFLDPGEPAAPFTRTAWTYNFATDEFEESVFDLEEHAGKVVFFHIFGTW